MSEIKSISVEEAAKDYGKNDHTYKSENAFLAGAEWQKEQDKEFTKKVWLNLVDGTFSNSWQSGGPYDIKFPNYDEEIKEAAKRGWKLIEYRCINDPEFELYNKMKLR